MKRIVIIMIIVLSIGLFVGCNDTPAQECTCGPWHYDSHSHYKNTICYVHNIYPGDNFDHSLEDGKCSVCGYCEYLITSNWKVTVIPMSSIEYNDNSVTYNLSSSASITITLDSGERERVFYQIEPIDKELLIGEIIIPSMVDDIEVISIKESAFSGCQSITAVTIPDSILQISRCAFSYCRNLSKITIPDSVMAIEEYAFNGCSKLEELVIPDSVTEIGNSAFSGCPNLKELVIPDSITRICSHAFSGCGLTSLIIPESVTTIDDYAFAGCYRLESLTIPKSVTNLSEIAFYGCNPMVIDNRSEIDIGYQFSSTAYELMGSPSDLVLYGLYTDMTPFAFRKCKGLMTLTIPGFMTTVGDNEFQDCTSLTSVIIPEHVTAIGNYAFKGCKQLSNITIPDSVVSIGAYAFSQCMLSSITIPDSVISIGPYALSSNRYLRSIELPHSLTEISNGLFYDCSSLSSLTIPDSITKIGMCVTPFKGANGPLHIYYTGTKDQWNSISKDEHWEHDLSDRGNWLSTLPRIHCSDGDIPF